MHYVVLYYSHIFDLKNDSKKETIIRDLFKLLTKKDRVKMVVFNKNNKLMAYIYFSSHVHAKIVVESFWEISISKECKKYNFKLEYENKQF